MHVIFNNMKQHWINMACNLFLAVNATWIVSVLQQYSRQSSAFEICWQAKEYQTDILIVRYWTEFDTIPYHLGPITDIRFAEDTATEWRRTSEEFNSVISSKSKNMATEQITIFIWNDTVFNNVTFSSDTKTRTGSIVYRLSHPNLARSSYFISFVMCLTFTAKQKLLFRYRFFCV